MERNDAPRSEIDPKGAGQPPTGCGSHAQEPSSASNGETYRSIKNRLPPVTRTWRELIEGLGRPAKTKGEAD